MWLWEYLVDQRGRDDLRLWLNNIGVPEGSTPQIMINRRLYNPAGEGAYRVPDVRIGDLTFDATIANKTARTQQIIDFAKFGNPREVIIVKPSTLGGITRLSGDRLRR